MDAGKTPLDTVLFSDARDPNLFSIKQTDDEAKAGVYPISYKAYYTSYSANFIEKTGAFTVIVHDPCDSPNGVTAAALADQEYTITQNAFSYQVPVYTPDPVWCDVIYSYTITNVAGDAAVTFDPDPLVRTFSFNQIDDLTLSGNTFTDYIVTVIGKSGNTSVV